MNFLFSFIDDILQKVSLQRRSKLNIHTPNVGEEVKLLFVFDDLIQAYSHKRV